MLIVDCNEVVLFHGEVGCFGGLLVQNGVLWYIPSSSALSRASSGLCLCEERTAEVPASWL